MPRRFGSPTSGAPDTPPPREPAAASHVSFGVTGPTASPPAQRYWCAGVSFALPSEWEDTTTFVARAPGADPSAPLVLRTFYVV